MAQLRRGQAICEVISGSANDGVSKQIESLALRSSMLVTAGKALAEERTRPALQITAVDSATRVTGCLRRTARCIAACANAKVIEPGSTPPAVLSDKV